MEIGSPKVPKKHQKQAKENGTGTSHEHHKTSIQLRTENIMKKVRSKRTLKMHEVNQIIMNEHQAVNFKSDAEHVSPEFYNLIKNSMKPRNVNNDKKQKENLTAIFEHR